MNDNGSQRVGLLERLALHRPELRAWALYDLANSTMITTIITAIYPIYFKAVASKGIDDAVSSSNHSAATTVALVLVAVMAPFLGALADMRPLKKRLLGMFAALGIAATASMFFIEEGDWRLAMVLFVLANIGVSSSFVFYDSLLPHVARPKEVDRVSTIGYALGYVGGGSLLLLNLAWIQKPEWFGLPHGEGLTASEETLPTRLAFLSVAVWWALFSIPLFRRVKEPALAVASEGAGMPPVREIVRRTWATVRELGRYRQAALLLVAFLIYNDGIATIFRMATVIGADRGFSPGVMISAIAIVQFVGIPCAIGFGLLASRFGGKRMVLCGLAVYVVITLLGYSMETEGEFFALALLVGLVQGGCQALSRSMYASMIPAEDSGKFFALFAVGEKFAGILGPGIFLVSIQLTGSTRSAILSILAFFVVGGFLLSRVDVDAGRRAIANRGSA